MSLMQHLRRLLVALAVAAIALPSTVPSAAASELQPVTIETSKPFGPQPGTFSMSGAVADAGSMEILSRVESGKGAPTFLVTHLKVLFSGTHGSFTIAAQIVETLTADPLVLTDSGSWTIVAGTGGYADLHASGSVMGLANEHLNLITRVYEGGVHAH